MANFTPSAKTAQNFNNGVEYVDGIGDIEGDVVHAESINNVIEGLLYTQGLAVNQPDFSEADNVGTPEVSVIPEQDGSARLKFKNLKGQTGETGATGQTGATGETGNGISSAVTTYAASTSGTTIPADSAWQSTIPTVPQGNYLWTRTVITYTDGETSTSYSLARQGVDGEGFNSQGNYPNASVGKLSTARTIDGVSFDGTASVTHYAVCDTASNNANKIISIPNFSFVAGARITANFINANTVSRPFLVINGSSVNTRGIFCKGRDTGLVWKAEIITFIYDGAYWQIIDGYSLADKPVNSHHVQRNGESTPAAQYGGTWVVDTDYAGRVSVYYGIAGNPLYKGTYSSTVQYYQNQIVLYSGNYYIAIGDTQGNIPTNTTYWTPYQNGATGGSATAVAVYHRHDVVNNAGSKIGVWTGTQAGKSVVSTYNNEESVSGDTWRTTYAGEDGTGKNMQPFIVETMWKRTA